MSGLRIRTAIALVTLALMLMASAIAAEGAEARATKVVRGVGTSWSPKVVRIERGSTITWKAVSTPHGDGLRRPLDLQPFVAGRFVRSALFHEDRRVQVPVHDPLTAREREVSRDVRQGRRASPGRIGPGEHGNRIRSGHRARRRDGPHALRTQH